VRDEHTWEFLSGNADGENRDESSFSTSDSRNQIVESWKKDIFLKLLQASGRLFSLEEHRAIPPRATPSYRLTQLPHVLLLPPPRSHKPRLVPAALFSPDYIRDSKLNSIFLSRVTCQRGELPTWGLSEIPRLARRRASRRSADTLARARWSALTPLRVRRWPHPAPAPPICFLRFNNNLQLPGGHIKWWSHLTQVISSTRHGVPVHIRNLSHTRSASPLLSPSLSPVVTPTLVLLRFV